MHKLQKIQTLFLILTVLTLVLVGLGAYVRTTGAGLSCPDWPLCFGQIVPDFTIAGVPQEVVHRYLAGIVGLLTIAVTYLTWLVKSEFPRLFKFSVALLVLVIVQGVFGGLTVTMKLHPHIVAMHLTLGTLFFQGIALGFIQTVKFRKGKLQARTSPYRSLVLFATVLTFVQIVWGGLVAAGGAALVCTDFPACNGMLLPDLSDGGLSNPVSLQILHRLFGIALFIAVSALALLGILGREGLKEQRGHLVGMFFMVILQIAVGVGNIHMKIPPAMSVAHLVIAEVILLGILMVYVGMNRKWQLFPSSVSQPPEPNF